jgi:hypothetical protein
MYKMKFDNLKGVYKLYENGLENLSHLLINEIWEHATVDYLEHLYPIKIKGKEGAELVKICYEACSPFIRDENLIIKLYSTVALHSMLTERLRD